MSAVLSFQSKQIKGQAFDFLSNAKASKELSLVILIRRHILEARAAEQHIAQLAAGDYL